MKHLKLFRLKASTERGFTLLEYCAGAAVLAGIVYVGMSAFGTGLSNFFTALGTWANSRASDLSS